MNVCVPGPARGGSKGPAPRPALSAPEPAAPCRVREALRAIVASDPRFTRLRHFLEQDERWRGLGIDDHAARPAASGLDWNTADAWAAVGCNSAESKAAAAFASSLDGPGLAALAGLAWRGHDPFHALGSLPLEALFSAEEIDFLKQLPRNQAAIQHRPILWSAGQPFSYAGVISVIMKVTRLCNMRCTYCLDWRAGPNQKMTFEVQAALFSSLFTPDDHRQIGLVWHGGEPTLIGHREFIRILRLQLWFLRPGQTVSNRIQTNATRIDPEWLALWTLFGIRVSASIDGDEQSHDRERPMAGGRGSHRVVTEGIRAIAAAGLLEHVYWVITPENVTLGAAKTWATIQGLGAPEVGLLPARVQAGTPAAQEADAHRFPHFLLALRQARAAAPEPWVAIREIDAAERAVQGEMPGFCELIGNCIGHVFAVDPDGTIQHCDRFVGDDDFLIGHVRQGGFVAARSGEKLALLRLRERQRLDRLRSCPQFARCQGWCPHVSYARQVWIAGSAEDCCGLRPLLDGIEGGNGGGVGQHQRSD